MARRVLMSHTYRSATQTGAILLWYILLCGTSGYRSAGLFKLPTRVESFDISSFAPPGMALR